MHGPDLFALRNMFTEKNIMICFNGPFSHSIIEEIGMAIKRYLETDDAPKSAITDVFAVFIEQTQNVRNYTSRKDVSAGDKYETGSGVLVIGKAGEKYTISSGNIVDKGDISAVIEKLDLLNKLDKQQLKALYKEQARKPMPESGGGAGLGLIDITRRAAGPVQYAVRDLNASSCFFSLTVTI